MYEPYIQFMTEDTNMTNPMVGVDKFIKRLYEMVAKLVTLHRIKIELSGKLLLHTHIVCNCQTYPHPTVPLVGKQ